jgi:hypothetical protein
MRTAYGILAGMLGVGAWLWMRRRRAAESSIGERGEVIFRNTPEPTAFSAEGVI